MQFNTSEPRADDAKRRTLIESLRLNEPGDDLRFSSVLKMLATAMGIPTVVFAIADGNRQIIKGHFGLTNDITAPNDISVCVHAVMRSGSLIVVPDARRDPRFTDNPLVTGQPDIGFYAGVLVRAHGNIPVGTICIVDSRARDLSTEELSFLLSARDTIEELIALRLEVGRDHLTGLFNRRHFDDIYSREWRRASRNLAPLGLLLIDADHFKKYNDIYGHQAGDDALCKLAEALRVGAHRAGDVLARYGGEEFVVILPETSPQGINFVAEKVLRSVRELNLVHSGSPEGILTVSIGGCVAQNQRELSIGVDGFMEKADQALYHAKDEGRNCFHIITASGKESPRTSALEGSGPLVQSTPRAKVEAAHAQYSQGSNI